MKNGEWSMGLARTSLPRIHHLFIYHFSFYINQLVGQPLVAIQEVDDAAVSEAVLQEYVLHDAVVPVRVRPQARHLAATPL